MLQADRVADLVNEGEIGVAAGLRIAVARETVGDPDVAAAADRWPV